MAGTFRRDRREEERASIVVSGENLARNTFEEQTESINISSSGIAFYLNNSIGPRSFISLELSQSKEFGYLGKIRAVVVRLENISSEKKFVAAEFI